MLYTYAGEHMGDGAGTDALRGLAVCFIAGTASSLHTPLPAPSRAPWPLLTTLPCPAGTASSLLAALITLKIEDGAAGLRCGPLVCVRPTGAYAAGEEGAAAKPTEGGRAGGSDAA